MNNEIIIVGGNKKLDKIVENKKNEVEQSKNKLGLSIIKKHLEEDGKIEIRDFKNALYSSSNMALIAEIKKASPSLGDINTGVDIRAQAQMYESSGADVLSILTDKHFKGELEFIHRIKTATNIPILRKDFIFDPYQIYESKYYGADAILLIATILTQEKLIELVDLTHELGMKCLVETHTESDMEKALNTKAKIIGINARNLQTFEVDLDNIVTVSKMVPEGRLLVAESGIDNVSDVEKVAKAGAGAILVGTILMRSKDLKCKIEELKAYEK